MKTIETINSDQLVNEIIEELNYMINVPQLELGDRAKQGALAISAEHIKQCLKGMIENEIFLLERLKHSETERFK